MSMTQHTRAQSKKVGIIAGRGRLPAAFALAARRAGFDPVVVAVAPSYDPELESAAADFRRVELGGLEEALSFLTARGVDEVVLLGKVDKAELFSGLRPDGRLQKVLAAARDGSDAAILGALCAELERAGLVVRPQAHFLERLLAREGVYTQRAPSADEWRDVVYGVEMAQKAAALGIGQAVAVKSRTVVAVEAVEGTDQTIRRAGELAGAGFVVAKASKADQDPRLDLPTVGPDTLRALAAAGGKVLAVEAGRCFVIDEDEAVRVADQAGISVVGVRPDGADGA